MGNLGAVEVAKIIRSSLSLVHIDISSNDIGPKGATEIFKALQTNQSVTSLDMSSREGLFRNRICEQGLRKPTPTLQSNKTLTLLNLSGNSIRAAGLEKILKGLTRNHTLLSLKIASNEIEGEERTLKCLKALASAKLLELDISENPLGNYCFGEFTAALCAPGCTLKFFYCASIGINCKLSKKVDTCIKPALNNMQASGTLQKLRIGGNNFSGRIELVLDLRTFINGYSLIQSLCLFKTGLNDLLGELIFAALRGNRVLETLLLHDNSLGVSLEVKSRSCRQKSLLNY
eukprot:TRINITY_DN14034_c0_g3_i1.p1 TRINITY_DN14034_c0_g3~~TRINITY_DN14034_c0_g3_i1.p1  ORF type:complete len:289 (+),score=34.86 TRINITY_DN14034_c0_g3_i1:526-1392(+)